MIGRLHKSLADISHFISAELEWSRSLCTYRKAPHTATRYTQQTLLFGQQMRLPDETPVNDEAAEQKLSALKGS